MIFIQEEARAPFLSEGLFDGCSEKNERKIDAEAWTIEFFFAPWHSLSYTPIAHELRVDCRLQDD